MANVIQNLILRLALVLSAMVLPAAAQEFQPPRPPPMEPNVDFDDMDEELIEMGDEGFRPPPPPPPPGQSGAGGPPNLGAPGGSAPIGGPVGGGNFGAQTAKLKFKIVEGEFWEKGKKRGRADRTATKK